MNARSPRFNRSSGNSTTTSTSGSVTIRSAAYHDDDGPPNKDFVSATMLKVYKPSRNFDAAIPETWGAAFQIDYKVSKVGIPALYWKLAHQNTPLLANNAAQYDWDHSRTSMRLSVWDISNMLAVLEDRKVVSDFVNRSDEGNIQIRIEQDGEEDYRITATQNNEPPKVISLPSHQAVAFRLFLDEGLRRILYGKANVNQ